MNILSFSFYNGGLCMGKVSVIEVSYAFIHENVDKIRMELRVFAILLIVPIVQHSRKFFLRIPKSSILSIEIWQK